jgi:hypothetical protein
MDVRLLCLLCVVYVAASATGSSLVQRSTVGSVYLIVCALETSELGCSVTEQNLAVFTQSRKVNAQWYYVS